MKKYIFLTAFISLIFLSFSLNAAENRSEDESGKKHINIETPPTIIKSVEPSYPSDLIGEYKEGRVVLRFIVTKDGTAEDIAVMQSTPPGVFDEYAIKAIKEYRFNPATRNGEPVKCVVNLPIEFALKEAGTGEEVITGYDAYKAAEAGLTYLSKGQYEQAIEAFSNAIRIYDKYGAAYCGRGVAYIEKREYQKAMADLNEAIRLDPETARYYKYRGRLYAILEDYQKAVDDFNEAIKIDKDMVDAYYFRGEAFMKSGKYREAIDDYTKVIDLDENNVQAYSNRGYSYNKLMDTKNACNDLRIACKLGDCLGLAVLQKAGKCCEDTSNTPDIATGGGSI